MMLQYLCCISHQISQLSTNLKTASRVNSMTKNLCHHSAQTKLQQSHHTVMLNSPQHDETRRNQPPDIGSIPKHHSLTQSLHSPHIIKVAHQNPIRLVLMSRSFVKSLMRSSNLFAIDNFWSSQGDRAYSSVCGGLVSLPLVGLIVILFVLKLLQMVNYGIVMSSTQLNYSYEPNMMTLSTLMNDSSYAPFMIGFNVNIDTANCPNTALPFEVYSLEMKGAINSTNRSSTKVPLNFETCTSDHFSMLPGNINKLKRWTNGSLNCLPLNSYFQLGGSSSVSTLYRSLQFKFTCPPGCNTSLASCGSVEFYSASSAVNLNNASSPFAYGLTRHKFSISTSPTNQISYQIDSSNLTTDNSILPFNLNNDIFGAAVGSVVSDIASPSGDLSTYITVQRSDKTTIYMRSYYKVFDLVAYIGGLIYGILILLFFLRNLSKIEFELNFAAEYFRIPDSKAITFRGYLKQLAYQILKHTCLKPDWGLAAQREQSREAVSKVLDVVYLNKRIAFLQEAISLLLQKHQLKGIHLLHTLSKKQLQNKINEHRFRDRLVYFFGNKYKNKLGEKVIREPKYPEGGREDHELCEFKREIDYSQSNGKIKRERKNSGKVKTNSVDISAEKMKSSGSLEEVNRQPKQERLSLKNLIRSKFLVEQKLHNQPSEMGSLIINEAERYYSEMAEVQRENNIIVINNRNDNSFLKRELDFIGQLSLEELDETELVEQLKNEVRLLMEQAERKDGSAVTKKIYGRLDSWLKNYLKDTLSSIQHL